MSIENLEITAVAIDHLNKEINQRAGNSILFVPDNWPSEEKEYAYPSTVESVTKLLKQNKVPVDSLHPIDATTPLHDNRGLDWIAPTFLVSGLLLTQNPMVVSIVLGIVANYVTDLFKGLKNDPKVKLNIVQTAADGKRAQRIKYEGPVSGLPEVEKVLSAFETKE